jgi:hypothetical protein
VLHLLCLHLLVLWGRGHFFVIILVDTVAAVEGSVDMLTAFGRSSFTSAVGIALCGGGFDRLIAGTAAGLVGLFAYLLEVLSI